VVADPNFAPIYGCATIGAVRPASPLDPYCGQGGVLAFSAMPIQHYVSQFLTRPWRRPKSNMLVYYDFETDRIDEAKARGDLDRANRP